MHTQSDNRESTPRVSIGMPVYNGADLLAESIESILAQEFTDFELIISDNASTDGTEEICRSYAETDQRIRYSRNETNLGAARNFNRTFELARGEYFKWTTYDDLIAPTYLGRCVELLDESSPSVVMCYPQRVLMDYDGEILGRDTNFKLFEAAPPYDRISFARLMRVPGFVFPMLVFGLMRSSVLRQTRLIGAFSHADLVLVTEMRLRGTFREIPAPLFFTRLPRLTPEFAKKRRTWEGEAAWYDPRAKSQNLKPEKRLLEEMLAAVKLAPRSFLVKFLCYACVLVGYGLTRWRILFGRRARKRFWDTWSTVSSHAVRHEGRFRLAHRAWALFSGLRHRRRNELKLALSWPSKENCEALSEFVGLRLAKRAESVGPLAVGCSGSEDTVTAQPETGRRVALPCVQGEKEQFA